MKRLLYPVVTVATCLATVFATSADLAGADYTESLMGGFIGKVEGPSHDIDPYFPHTINQPFVADRTPFKSECPVSKEYNFNWPSHGHDAFLFTGMAVVSGGTRGFPASAQVTVTTTSSTDDNRSWGRIGLGGGACYSVRLDLREQPPFVVPGGVIPYKVEALGEASRDAPSENTGSFARCSLHIFSADYSADWSWSAEVSAVTEKLYDAFVATETVWVTPSQWGDNWYTQVEVTTEASTMVEFLTQASISAYASVDPKFTFDQAAFDALMGEETFPLKEYFTLTFSKGVDPVGSTYPVRSLPALFLLLE